jgi:hypothetical protein
MVASVLVCSSQITFAGNWLSPSGAALTAVERAHNAFVARDYLGLTGAAKEVLLGTDTDETTKKNILDLLSKAKIEQNGSLPVDWHLPAEIDKVDFKLNRRSIPDGVKFDFVFRGRMKEADSISQLQITAYPGLTILDKQNHIGQWKTHPEEGKFDFELSDRTGTREPLAEGLYLFTLELKDGARTEGWFVVNHLASSASPKLLYPAVGEAMTTHNPQIRWEDFRSPEYQPEERRNVYVYVNPPDSDTEEFGWNFWEQHPSRTSIEVGKTVGGTGVSSLAKGPYWLTLGYCESSNFGDMRLSRCSRTGRPFSVVD